jgi:hypothetical protein
VNQFHRLTMAKKQHSSRLDKLKDFRKKKTFLYNRWIVKNIPFYLFISALTILYIANGHYADKTIRKINATAKHLKEMEYEYKTVERDVIFRSKESELAKAVAPLGLKELMMPPFRLKDSIIKN